MSNPKGTLVAENDGTEIYFDANTQIYNVYRDGKFLIGDKYKFSDVETYVSVSPSTSKKS